MNHYKTSDGQRVSKQYIDSKVRQAKEQKLNLQLEEFGYNFCMECLRNDCLPLDCSHIISVDECQKTGRSELAWDLDNIRIIGRRHHQVHDGLNLQFSKDE